MEETARIFFKNKASEAPVVDHEGKVVGLVTQTDLFGIFVPLTGGGEKGIQGKDQPSLHSGLSPEQKRTLINEN